MSMVDPVEEARAAAFRAQGSRRIQNERARALALGGDRVTRAGVLASWEPVRAWLADKRGGGPAGGPGTTENWPDRPHGRGPHRQNAED